MTDEERALLIHRYYMRQIGVMMQQAEHWAANGKPLAVHHRVMGADTYFQVANLFDPKQLDLGWKPPFVRIEEELARPPIYPDGVERAGSYPPSREIHRYRDVRFVVAELDKVKMP